MELENVLFRIVIMIKKLRAQRAKILSTFHEQKAANARKIAQKLRKSRTFARTEKSCQICIYAKNNLKYAIMQLKRARYAVMRKPLTGP